MSRSDPAVRRVAGQPSSRSAEVPCTDRVDDQSPIASVDKALRVLAELAASGPQGLALAEVAARVGVNKTTIHRTLSALRHRGFARQDPSSGCYVLGTTAVLLADEYRKDDHLPQLLHPVLVALCARTEELVHLGVLSGNEVAYLDKVEPIRAVRVWSAVGRRTPAASTALGRALIAYQSPHRSSMPWYVSALPPASPLRVDDLWRLVEITRGRGFSTEQEENEPGISCLAVPLLRGNVPVAAVSVTAPADRMGARRLRELSRIVPQVLTGLLPEDLALPAALTAG
jgi:IclR family acetate operon transcriptional repressor